MKAFAITILALATTASTAFAQKNGDKPQGNKQLLQQIADLKATVARLKEQSAQQRAQAAFARQVAEKQRLIAEQRAKALAEEERARALEYKRRAAARLEKHKPGKHEPPAEIREAIEKLENLRAAVKHLQAAGMKDLAAEAAKRAERMQDGIQAALQKHKHVKGNEPEHKPMRGITPDQLHEISKAIMQLRGQVQQLQKAVERLERRK